MMKLMRSVVLVVTATMLAFTSAHAGWYLSIHGGPNFPTTSNAEATAFGTTFSLGDLSPRTGFLLGAQLGYDFLGDSQTFPAWTQYLTLAFDFTGNNLSIPGKSFTYQSGNNINYGYLSDSDGGQLAWTFLLIGKLPLMASEEFPKGRLFPYVGVGPSLVLTTFNNSSLDLGVMVEPGVRFMFTRNFSGDLAYRFLYVSPSVNPSGGDDLSWDSMNHAIVLRLSYHF